MAVHEDIIGTWFPSGYFGHFRSKTRNDILQEYRHAATPNPPAKFVERVRLCPDRHSFSKHDNKHSFPTDASYFDTGLGRRKSGRASTIFKPDFISWLPLKDELKKEGAAVSVYRLNFRHGDDTSRPVAQRLSPRVRRRMAQQDDDFARLKWVSDYKNYFQHGQPSSVINTDFNTGKVFDGPEKNPRTHHDLNATGKLRKVIPHYMAHTTSAHIRRRTKSAPVMRMSVGDCLMWPQEQLNESIVIPNRYDKRSDTYKFRDPFSPKLPRKFKNSKPPTKETLLKPPPYHERDKVYPPAPKPHPPSKINPPKPEMYTRVPPNPEIRIDPPYSDVITTPPQTPRSVEPPMMTSPPQSSFGSTPERKVSMTPAATPVTIFSPTEPAASPTWSQGNPIPIPTVVVN